MHAAAHPRCPIFFATLPPEHRSRSLCTEESNATLALRGASAVDLSVLLWELDEGAVARCLPERHFAAFSLIQNELAGDPYDSQRARSRLLKAFHTSKCALSHDKVHGLLGILPIDARARAIPTDDSVQQMPLLFELWKSWTFSHSMRRGTMPSGLCELPWVCHGLQSCKE
jgi:hypothetical protein